MKKRDLFLIIFILLNVFLFAQSVPCYNTSTFLTVDEKGGKFGFVDKDNKVKIKYLYDESTDFSFYVYAIAKRDNKTFIIDTLGNEHLIVEDINLLTEDVKGINLSYKSLKEIPREIFDYHQLEYLILRANEIKTVPKEIGNLKNLKFLDLCSNDITNLPNEISSLHKMEFLTLNYSEDIDHTQIFKLFNDYPKKIILTSDHVFNRFDPEALLINVSWFDIEPNAIIDIQNLSQINISDWDLRFEMILPALEKLQQKIIITNKLKTSFYGKDTVFVKISPDAEISSKIGDIKNLVKLDLEKVKYNEGEYLPINKFINVSSLKLTDCQINEFPNIGLFKDLEVLDLSKNYIEELPQDIGISEKLKYINLSLNELNEFNIPFKNAPNLTHLDISGNNIEYLSAEIKKLKNLQTLNISGNMLMDFPFEILKLKNLIELDLSENSFEEIPKEIIKLKNLEKLDLSDTDIIDLPLNLDKLTKLKQLILSGNYLDDDIKKRIKASLPNCEVLF